MFERREEINIREALHAETHKILVLYGPRQAGKTTLAKKILRDLPDSVFINADLGKYRDIFSSFDLDKMKETIGNARYLFIDEAQNIQNIGANLKILFDEMPHLKIMITGSSSIEIADQTKESLTGRTKTFLLFPLSFGELADKWGAAEVTHRLSELMIYGSYPEVINTMGGNDKREFLEELTAAYLYKDILNLSGIKYAEKLRKLLQLLSFQIGKPVSYNELSNALQLNHDTVAHYIDLLEKGFVIFKLPGFSRNLRKEVVKMNKIYFFDLGVRNCLINNFNTLDLRNDLGAMWENFLVSERLKHTLYQRDRYSRYYWRTYTGAELDYLEEKDGLLHGYEFKWDKMAKVPKSWTEHYPDAHFSCINRTNFKSFLL
ncbi:MAG: ATP-binding protein [Cytophagaceae bacterium]|jgi:hypothetical protein|nr:ATP-binding protein [Cytophagaceae bacterium]